MKAKPARASIRSGGGTVAQILVAPPRGDGLNWM